MPEFTLSVKHGKTLEEARNQLETVIHEVRGKFGSMIQRVEWSPDRNHVKVYATGVELDMHVDPVQVHVVGNIAGVAGVLSAPLLLGFQGIFRRSFPKSLPAPK